MAKKAPSSATVVFDASMRIVVLHGTERYLRQEHTRALIEALRAKFGEPEQFAFDGESVQPAVVLDELRSYGLMQRHKLVIVDQADIFLAGGVKPEDEEEQAKKSGPSMQRKLLEKYAEKPVEDATLLLRADTWRPGNIDKLIAKIGILVPCEEQGESTAINWCIKRVARRYDATIEPDAAELLVARHGTSLQHLDTELARLAAMAGGGKTITRQLVADNTVLSREEKAWEIQSAVASGDAAVMLGKLHELVDVSRHDLVPLNWSVCDLLRKVHAAGHMLRSGVPANAIFSQLRLYGGAGGAVIEWGRQLEPAMAAQLLQAAISADRHNKSGFGEPMRNLESLMVTIADEVHGDN